MSMLYFGRQKVSPVIKISETIPNYVVDGYGNVKRKTDIVLTGNEFKNMKNIYSYALYYEFYNCNVSGILDLSSLTSVEAYSLLYAFSNSNITSVNLSSLERATGFEAFRNTFSGCRSLTNVDLSNLTTVSGESSMYSMFDSCFSLENIDLSNLTTVSGRNSLGCLFMRCTSLKNMNFQKLSSITGASCLSNLCYLCSSIENVYFPALTTSSFGSNKNQFQYFFNAAGTNCVHTIHFPSNLETIVQGLTGYPLFGGPSGYVVCAFDLPATS